MKLFSPVTFAFIAGVSASLNAQTVISFNVADTRINMATSDLAGAVERVGNWNNYNNQTALDAQGFVYDDGSLIAETFTVIRTGGNPAQIDNFSTNDDRMYSGNVDMQNGSTYTLDLANIPFAQYDIYVYVRGTSSTRGGSVALGSETYYVKNGSKANSDGTGYTLITSTVYDPENPGVGIAAGNYIVFEGLSGANQTITMEVLDMGNASIQRLNYAGFQIVQVPEPETFALIAGVVIALGVIGVKRRKRS